MSRKHFWLSIRITQNTVPQWIKPRWHRDGHFFDDTTRSEIKFVTTLLGANTLIAPTENSIYSQFDNIIKEKRNEQDIYVKKHKLDPHSAIAREYYQQLNKKYNTLFENIPIDYQAIHNNTGILFASGTPDAAIHSEPMMDKPRIFISIVPGTEMEILQLKANRER